MIIFFAHNVFFHGSVEIVVEPVIPALECSKKLDLKTKYRGEYTVGLSHPKTPQDSVDVLWVAKKNTLGLSTRLLLALYIDLKPSLEKFCKKIFVVPSVEFSHDVIKEINLVTFVALLFRGDHLGALTLRASLLRNSEESCISKELKLVEALLKLHPKSLALWMYRRFALKMSRFINFQVTEEIQLIQSHTQLASCNYYPWMHWAWLTMIKKDDSIYISFKKDIVKEIRARKIKFLQNSMGLTPFHLAPYHHCYRSIRAMDNPSESLVKELKYLGETLVQLYPKSEAAWLFLYLLSFIPSGNFESLLIKKKAFFHSRKWKGWKPANFLLWKYYCLEKLSLIR